jgi:hypothetical protein
VGTVSLATSNLYTRAVSHHVVDTDDISQANADGVLLDYRVPEAGVAGFGTELLRMFVHADEAVSTFSNEK